MRIEGRDRSDRGSRRVQRIERSFCRRVVGLGLALVSVWVLALACSSESDDSASTNASDASDASETPVQAAIPAEQVARNADPRPSVLLIVIDTLRADAVSAYGAVQGTTPTIDQLARSGVRYERVFAPAPWTVSSHTSLFTGLRVDQHGVGLGGVEVAPDSLEMIAEHFRDAGYATAGFAENILVSPHFGLDQGFDHFESRDIVSLMKAAVAGDKPKSNFDLVDSVRRWHESHDKSRPYFVFINIFDPHNPYTVRRENPWIPEGMSKSEAEFVASQHDVGMSLCDDVPTGLDLDVLRGLYLGDVAAADAKVAKLLHIFEKSDSATPDITIVTSDHGEHLGEHRLMGHQFSVREPVLRIPLVVVGLPNVEPAVVQRAVELRQLHHSILCWALGEHCPASLPVHAVEPAAGVASDTSNASKAPIISIYSDSVSVLPDFIVDQFDVPEDRDRTDYTRAKCSEKDRVFGEMVSLIRYPMKIIWFEKGPPEMYDLSWDPGEQFDQLASQPKEAAALESEIDGFVKTNLVDRKPSSSPELDEEGIRALKALGYVQ